ncbi:MAG: PDZ domain-containing protein [Elusimicrobiota bacterium]
MEERKRKKMINKLFLYCLNLFFLCLLPSSLFLLPSVSSADDQRLVVSFYIIEADKIKLTKHELFSDINNLTKRKNSDKFNYLGGGDFTLSPYISETFNVRQQDSDLSLKLSCRPKQVLDKKYYSIRYEARLAYPLQKEYAVLQKETDAAPGEIIIISESDTTQGLKDTRPIWVVLKTQSTEPEYAYSALGGIGAKIQLRDGYPFISEILDESPAKNAGLQVGDKLLEADGYSLLQVTIDEASKLLRGNPGTDVSLKIRRASSTAPEIIILKRRILE